MKEKIAITIDAELLNKIDTLAELKETSRSAIINQMVETGVEEQEEFLEQMQDPIYRTIIAALSASPALLHNISKLVRQEISLDDAKQFKENIEKHKKIASKRTLNKDKGENRG